MQKKILRGKQALTRLFNGYVEGVFQQRIGLTSPSLADYLANLLIRFVHIRSIQKLRNLEGRRIENITEMVIEATQRQGQPRIDALRHVGDVALFWSGYYPGVLLNPRRKKRLSHLIDCMQIGKDSYYAASQYLAETNEKQASVLMQLSHEFDLCAYGLSLVRKEIKQAA